MEQVKVDTPRSAPPSWARPDTGEGVDPESWTEPQKAYVLSLIAERNTSILPKDNQDWLQSLVDGKRYLTKRAASELIGKLQKLDKVTIRTEQGELSVDHADRFAVGVPAGRYAVENDAGELRFYKVWVSYDKKRLNVYVEHGPDESDLKFQKTTLGVLNKIKAAGIRQCAIRYGMEIGECSNCGRRLTNRISRELGIGPVCGGRMFGDDFKGDVKQARATIRARGEDPNEQV